jgi:hypothetical protein
MQTPLFCEVTMNESGQWMPAKTRRTMAMADHMAGGLVAIAVHELGALSGHWSELQERVAVARRSRSVLELVRDQFDLLPETRNRLSQDQQLRLELWSGLVRGQSGRAGDSARIRRS